MWVQGTTHWMWLLLRADESIHHHEGKTVAMLPLVVSWRHLVNAYLGKAGMV